MLAGAVEQLGRHHPRLDPEPLLEAPPQRLGDRQRVAQRPGQRLGGFLEIGEMVALGLDMVAHPALGGQRRARLALLALAADRRVAPHVGEGGVEPGDRVGHRRRIVGDLEQLVARDAEVGEHRVGEDLGELLGAGAVRALGGEALEVDVIGLGEPKQHLRGHRPLVALEMVQIGRRDADLGRHRALVEPELAPQPPDPPAQIEFPLARHDCNVVTNLQRSQV